MPNLRISEAAALLGVSDDTVRRWVEQGRLAEVRLDSGRKGVDGRELAGLARRLAEAPEPGATVAASARNRMRGIVTRVVKDGVMAQVEMQAGPFRVVSLMSRESADELGLEAGCVAVASIKSTHVVVEIPGA
ncbi:TOBE domain-containing protein [Saccharothrix lopnurensis]|uniref:Molybdopterin-binding protein n=1 Tax=Saccharothrix lopnurensis TaxID=1670621 RepID=A0ABW1PAU3_9PSEU